MSEKNSSVIQTRAIGGVYLLLLIVGINAVCTQFVAERLSYNPVLDEPLFARFYNPFAWWVWFRNFYSYAPNTYHYAFLIFLAGFFLSVFGCCLYIGLKTRSSRKHEGSHGTAAFATYEQVKATGLIHDKNGSGVYCGGYLPMAIAMVP